MGGREVVNGSERKMSGGCNARSVRIKTVLIKQ